jgi:hypothetical protein
VSISCYMPRAERQLAASAQQRYHVMPWLSDVPTREYFRSMWRSSAAFTPRLGSTYACAFHIFIAITVGCRYEEDADRRERFYYTMLGGGGTPPASACPDVARLVVQQHFNCPSAWCILPLQVRPTWRLAKPGPVCANNPGSELCTGQLAVLQ